MRFWYADSARLASRNSTFFSRMIWNTSRFRQRCSSISTSCRMGSSSTHTVSGCTVAITCSTSSTLRWETCAVPTIQMSRPSSERWTTWSLKLGSLMRQRLAIAPVLQVLPVHVTGTSKVTSALPSPLKSAMARTTPAVELSFTH